MTSAEPGSVVIDTMVISWLVNADPRNLKDAYRELVGGRKIVIALQTLAELRAGAYEAGWGELRRRRLERSLADFRTARPDNATATIYAKVKADCRRLGHGLANKNHDGDRWIAAAAIRANVPLASHDGIFRDVPGLTLITANT